MVYPNMKIFCVYDFLLSAKHSIGVHRSYITKYPGSSKLDNGSE